MPATTKYRESEKVPSIIYALIDPFTGDVCYVGKTVKTLNDRWRAHIRYSSSSNTKKNCWIRSCIDKGEHPYIEELDSGVWDLQTINSREIYWIDRLSASFSLKNGTTGGEGGSGRVISDETRTLASNNAKELWTSDDYRESIAAGQQEYWGDNDRARDAVSKQSRARWEDPDYKARKTFESEEYRARRSKIAKGVSESPKMLKVLAENGTKSMKNKRVCDECGYVGAAAHMGTHQKYSSHQGYTLLEGEKP